MIFVVIVAATVVIVSSAVFAWKFQRYRKRQFESIQTIGQGHDVDGFMAKIDQEIQRTNNDSHRRLLQVNKSTGLFYKGEWAAATTLLEQIEPSVLPIKFRALYYSNLLFSKLMLDDIDAANQLYARHLASLAPYIPDRNLDLSVNITIGALEYYNGEISTSKAKLSQALRKDRAPILTAVAQYFMGLIAMSEEIPALATQYFEQALVTGKGTWVAEYAWNQPIALKQSGSEFEKKVIGLKV